MIDEICKVLINFECEDQLLNFKRILITEAMKKFIGNGLEKKQKKDMNAYIFFL